MNSKHWIKLNEDNTESEEITVFIVERWRSELIKINQSNLDLKKIDYFNN